MVAMGRIIGRLLGWIVERGRLRQGVDNSGVMGSQSGVEE